MLSPVSTAIGDLWSMMVYHHTQAHSAWPSLR